MMINRLKLKAKRLLKKCCKQNGTQSESMGCVRVGPGKKKKEVNETKLERKTIAKSVGGRDNNDKVSRTKTAGRQGKNDDTSMIYYSLRRTSVRLNPAFEP